MIRSSLTARTVFALALIGLLSGGCATPPKPAVCATVGAVLGGGAGVAARHSHPHYSDGEQAASGAVGAIVFGSAGYFLCRAIASDEPEAAAEPAEPMAATEPMAPAPTAPQARGEEPALTQSPIAERIVLRGVNFDFDKAEIRPDAAVILDEAIRILADRPAVKLQVAGHTDWTGTDAYNQTLSERRAGSVQAYLVKSGIGGDRLTAVGHGESQPVASNETSEGRALNRRVELNVLE